MFCHLLLKKLFEKLGKKMIKAEVEAKANQSEQKNSAKFDNRKFIKWNGELWWITKPRCKFRKDFYQNLVCIRIFPFLHSSIKLILCKEWKSIIWKAGITYILPRSRTITYLISVADILDVRSGTRHYFSIDRKCAYRHQISILHFTVRDCSIDAFK